MQIDVQGIGGRIKQRRLQLNLTQGELAELVGLKGADSVSKHERGVMGVGGETIRKYAKALRVSMDWLAGDIQDTGQPRVAGEGVPPTRLRPGLLDDSSGAPMGIVWLLNDGRCNPITADEIGHLTRHLADGNSAELADLEVHLTAHRAERDRTDGALAKFRNAVHRARRERRMQGVSEPAPPPAGTRKQKKKKTEFTQ